MTSRHVTFVVAVVCVAAALLAKLASAQFQPDYNHLKCYGIKDQGILKLVLTDNQFGRERIYKLVPAMLCLPTKKTCCSNPSPKEPCVEVPCPQNPTDFQPAPVDHFKCYKVTAKTCVDTDPTCANFAKFHKRNYMVDLQDQFGIELDVLVSNPRFLCAPVRKYNVRTVDVTTTTTSSTSTTVPTPCNMTEPACNGACIAGQRCSTQLGGGGCQCCTLPGGPCDSSCCTACSVITGLCCSHTGYPCTANPECCSNHCGPNNTCVYP
jgi:hypothetical protein